MSITPEQQSIIDKVLKLLELGKEETNEFAGQRDTANAKAAELMAKYSIDFADLRAGKTNKGFFEQFDLKMDKDPVNWEASLANVIAHAFDVKVIQRKFPWTLMYCGTKTDIEISVFFFKYIRRSIGMMASRQFSRKADQTTFAYGAVNIIDERLQALYKKRDEAFTNDSRALMVIKKDGLDKFVREQFPNLRKGSPIKLSGSMEAHRAGQEHGRTVNLSRPLGQSNAGTKTHQIK